MVGLNAQNSREFNVLLLDTKLSNCNHYIVLGILDALKSSPRVRSVKKVHYGNVLKEASTHQYNLFLAVDAEEIETSICSRVAGLVDVSILWSMEDPYERHVISRFSSIFDIVLTNDDGSVNYYNPPAIHMPLGGSLKFNYFPVIEDENKFLYDVYFIGTAWPNRVNLIQSLQYRLPDLNYKISLQYNPYLPPLQLNRPLSSYIGTVSNRQFCQLANRSRITLGLHRDFAGSLHNSRATTPGPRFFETALAGGFQLADEEFVDVGSFFRKDEEIALFSSVDECIEKIEYYLSHAEERRAIAKVAQRSALERHTYSHRVEEIFRHVDALSQRHVRIPTSIELGKGKPRLLFVTHNTLERGHWGGVEVYQSIVAKYIKDEFDVFYYRFDGNGRDANGGRTVEFVLTNSEHKILEKISVPEFSSVFELTNPKLENAYADMLVRWRIDVIHYQHLINHVISLPLISKMLGIPSAFTFHDFYMACTRFNMIGYNGRFCNSSSARIEDCDVCLNATERLPAGSQAIRRAFVSKVLDSVDTIIGNSPSAVAIMTAAYPELAGREDIVQLGALMPNTLPMRELTAIDEDKSSSDGDDTVKKMRVAFLGNVTALKGADVLIHTANQLRNDPVEIHIFGRVDPPYDELLRALNFQRVHVHGAYQPGQLKLDGMDLSLHLSTWPETYCITLSEAWSQGLVPVVSKIGALADRVKDGENGFVIAVDAPGELAALLRRLAVDPEAIAAIRQNVTRDLWITAEQHVDVLSGIYANLLRSCATACDAAPFGFEHTANVSTVTGRTILATWRWNQGDSLNVSAPYIPDVVDMLKVDPPQPLSHSRPDERAVVQVRMVNGVAVDVNTPQRVDVSPTTRITMHLFTTTTSDRPWNGKLVFCLEGAERGDRLYLPVDIPNGSGEFTVDCGFPHPDLNGTYAVCVLEISEGTVLERYANICLLVKYGAVVAFVNEPRTTGSPPVRRRLNASFEALPTIVGHAKGCVDRAVVYPMGGTPKATDGDQVSDIVHLRDGANQNDGICLEIEGWVVDSQLQEVWDDVVVALEGPVVYYASAIRKQREDVAAVTETPWYLNAGFFCRCWISNPEYGRYRVSLLQKANGILKKYESNIRINIVSLMPRLAVSDGALSIVEGTEIAGENLPVAHGQVTLTGKTLEHPAVEDGERTKGFIDAIVTASAGKPGDGKKDIVIKRESDDDISRIFYVSGWAVDLQSQDVQNPAFLKLTGVDVFYFALERHPRLDIAVMFANSTGTDVGFSGTVDTTALPRGEYSVTISLLTNKEELLLPTSWSVMIEDK